MNKLIHDKIRQYIRLIGFGVDKESMFGYLQGYINGLFDSSVINDNQYRRYMHYINFKFISLS